VALVDTLDWEELNAAPESGFALDAHLAQIITQ
jgi:hypothetical protein